MSYGHFSENGKYYSITTPKTPSQWTNYIFNDGFMSNVDQILQGPTKIVENYSQTAFTKGNRRFYVRDRKSGECWQPNSFDVTGDFCCDHYLNKTILHYEQSGIKSDIRIFVPVKGIIEYWSITITNNSDTEREISTFAAIDFPDSGPMGGSCVYEDGVVYKYTFPAHALYQDKEKVEKRRAYYFLTSDVEPASCDMSEYWFFGNYYCGGMPAAVKNDTCSNNLGEVENYLAAMQHTYKLAPGESGTVHFAVSFVRTKQEMFDVKKALTAENIEKEMQLSDERFEKLTESFAISTPNKDLDHLVNHWLKKQAMFLTRLNRMGTFCPIRNQFQDAMGYSLIEPKEAANYMLKLVARQQKCGFTQQWYDTDGARPAGLALLRHCDANVWLVLCICLLANQLGDITFFDKVVPYIDEGEDTIYNHLINGIEYMTGDIGAHGLNLMHDGDWTDPINGIGKEGRGESTWTTVAMMYVIKEFQKICTAKGDTKTYDRLQEIWETYDKAVNENAWNGDRYIGGYDDNGVAFADTADSNRVLLNAQTWAILAGAARGERLEATIKAIDSLDSNFGSYLFKPHFTEWDSRWGRISIKKSGTTENGAVYCHATMFKAYADAAVKDANKLYQSLIRTTPMNPLNDVEINRQLPLYLTNYYYSLEGSANYGRSSCNYGTGTAAWFLMATLEKLIGVEATVNGLHVSPLLPDEWNEAGCTRIFKDAKYNITVKRGAETTVNGEKFDGEYLPYEDGKEYNVVWGF